MEPDLFSPFYTNAISIPVTGSIHAIITDAGIGSVWKPSAAEKAAIATGAVVMVFIPGEKVHPPMFVQALLDSTSDPTLGIPPESHLARVKLVGGPFNNAWTPASFGRALIYRSGPTGDESSYEAYGHIPGDPDNEYRHLSTYLASTIPGANYIEKTANLATERAECDAFRQAAYLSNSYGVLPPQASSLTTPLSRAQAFFILNKYPGVPQPESLVPGP